MCFSGLLSKYDEEIAGRENKKSFAIGAGGQYDEDEVLRQGLCNWILIYKKHKQFLIIWRSLHVRNSVW